MRLLLKYCAEAGHICDGFIYDNNQNCFFGQGMKPSNIYPKTGNTVYIKRCRSKWDCNSGKCTDGYCE